jgi:hypothetical protein
MWRIPGVIDGTEEIYCKSISSSSGSPVHITFAASQAEGPAPFLERGVEQISLD